MEDIDTEPSRTLPNFPDLLPTPCHSARSRRIKVPDQNNRIFEVLRTVAPQPQTPDPISSCKRQRTLGLGLAMLLVTAIDQSHFSQLTLPLPHLSGRIPAGVNRASDTRTLNMVQEECWNCRRTPHRPTEAMSSDPGNLLTKKKPAFQ
ncbi:hypothetical protein mRhiFer1_007844 [Rhinolophus ferrumequinum]|uniref:Uncharacterized protein n=1 Tax=Rhinolophus ferrumequinum TaxID=59479 RepID=A0A7J8AVG7_RHIFE|nr:hypothetical protein mRhiFer1_007844 [Rhinolophus ferrumequinum]